MPAYSYKAITPQGVPKEGVLDAASEAQAAENLHAQGLIPIKILAGKAAWQYNRCQQKIRQTVRQQKSQPARHHGDNPANVYHAQGRVAARSRPRHSVGNW